MAKVDLKTLGRNSLVAALAEVWRVVSRFILTPIIIAFIGLEGYGVWTLVFSVAAYVSMANVSFGMAYTKFTAECVHHQQYDRLARIIGSGMVGIGTVALLGFGATLLWGEAIMLALQVPAEHAGDAATGLSIVVGTLMVRMTIGCAYEVLSGLQRMDLMSRVTVIASLIDMCVTIPLLYRGYGLVGLAIGHAVGYSTSCFIAYLLVKREDSRVVISPLRLSREGFGLMLSVGGKFQLLTGVTTIVMHGMKFVISAIIGPWWVGVYELADKLVQLGRAASTAVVAPLMPAFADLQAQRDEKKERHLFLKGSKADGVISGASFGFLALFALPALLIWTGEHVPEAAWALQVIAAGEAAFVLTSVISSNLRARGQIRLEFTTAMIGTGVVLVLVYPMAEWLAFTGLVITRLIAQLISATWYLAAYLRVAKIPWSEYLAGTRIGRVGALLAVTMGVVGSAAYLLPAPALGGLSPRWNAVLFVGLWAIPFGGILFAGTWRLIFDDEERALVVRIWGKIVSKIRGKLGRPTA